MQTCQPPSPLKKHYMQEVPWVEKCPIVIQFLGTYVIVMGVKNNYGDVAPWIPK